MPALPPPALPAPTDAPRCAPGAWPPGDAAPPFPHGPFLVGRDGRLRPRPPGRPSLRFRWRGLPCSAEFTGAEGEPVLRLAAALGRIPYTAEDSAARRAAFRLLRDLPAGQVRFALTADHHLQAECRATGEVTAIALCGAMVRFGLALDPLLHRLAEAGALRGADPPPPA
ncbi:MAG: hypothetical protein K2X11_11775 [Acetobacteraceae bacterium]|nr:hypothetical protein [Acetobacteraceae bacterium]